jgi:acetoacetyl-CoA reductase
MSENKNEKKIALVTGGTRGIGSAISRYLQEHGFHVIANYHSNDEAAIAFKAETGIDISKFDVANFADVQEKVTALIEVFGRVDVLVNNAGITKDGFLHKMSETDWDSVVNTNLKSAFNVTRAVLNSMRDNNFGRIVNISSINAQKGQIGQVNYCAAKAGLIGLTKALALEGARKNITANIICPGYIETDMTSAIAADILSGIISTIPMGRMGKPEEIGALVAYLASEDSAFTTGAVFSINGGQYMAG